MNKNTINYRALLNEAMHNVIRGALLYVKDDIVPGEHFFYISFVTDFRGVKISDALKKQYPEQMTIVLQYQFSNLIIEEDKFTVTLMFNNKKEKLTIPYKSILRFADPSVNIELHFVPTMDEDENKEEKEDISDDEEKFLKKESENSQQMENVISLDKFRKK